MSSPSVSQLETDYSALYNVPTWVTKSLVQTESGGNPASIGDHGTSVGLLQLHQGNGQGAGYTTSELQNPATNLSIGMPPISIAYQAGVQKGLKGYQLLQYTASHSGHPTETGVLPSSYNSRLATAYQTVTGTSARTPSQNTSTAAATQGAPAGLTNPTGGTSWLAAGPYTTNYGGGVGGFSTRVFFGVVGVGLLMLGLYVLVNPAGELPKAIASLGSNAAEAGMRPVTSRVQSANRALKGGS